MQQWLHDPIFAPSYCVYTVENTPFCWCSVTGQCTIRRRWPCSGNRADLRTRGGIPCQKIKKLRGLSVCIRMCAKSRPKSVRACVRAIGPLHLHPTPPPPGCCVHAAVVANNKPAAGLCVRIQAAGCLRFVAALRRCSLFPEERV